MRCLLRLGATGQIEVVSPYDAVTQAQLRAIRPRGVWSGRQRCWHFPLEAAPALQRVLAGRFPVEPELAQWLAWMEQPLPPLPLHRQLVAAADLQRPLPDGRQLFAHQRAAVRWLLARRGAVLADAMGLGKTLSALAAARAMVRLADCRILVIAPVGLHGHWQSEAAALGLRLELHSWARLPQALPLAGTVLIADEAHYAQNGQTRRSQGLLRLARHPRLRAIWLLTGTPMKNGRPAQLFPLLAAIGHPLARDQRAFEELFCQGHWREQGGRRLWQASGASHLEELQRLVRPLVLHRRKQDCLDLPPKHRQLWPVALDDLQARGFQHRLQIKVDDYRRRAASGEVRRDAEVLAVLTALRQIGSDYKLPATCSLVASLLAQGEAVVVFTAFVATAQLLHRRFAASALLTGALPPAQRQLQVDAFQRGDHPLLIATYGTGGLGFTLHRARHVVLVERPWTPGDAEQAEDRCHRIGMGAALTSHWLQLGVADQLVDGLIASKAERIALLLQRRPHRLERRSLPAMVRDLIDRW
ncbi:DEAD/DEAH box helicase [Cyanobium sp. Aljojuca 7D2]|uniref:DEAD/DEAH box helicase n=1 Tax=Cyanobium sp. Aljojuca 7D2 TaxID=2823698 RepID=UPI0020CD2C8A|nr:DEAD/DEAH box helicase [Cyanobium sp. Aljojuca 7D2]MCP9890181.1 DEAD/DEAH box helicase [Cyanobium sp. Aljojuca 7D2]